MRILFLGNNWVSWRVLQWLQEQEIEIVGLVLHPQEKRNYGEEILRSAQVEPDYIFDGSRINHPETLKVIKDLQPEIGLSVLFGYILTSEFLDIFPDGVINLHPAFLPYNRGAYPNVWSIVDGTPAGVTLHYIDQGIDTGDIIAKYQVPVEPVDTGETLYHKLEQASVKIFKNTWPKIQSGQVSRISQRKKEGTYHSTTDIEKIDYIELDREYTAKEIIDIIRARTFPPYGGAYFIDKGRKVYLRLELLYESQLQEEK